MEAHFEVVQLRIRVRTSAGSASPASVTSTTSFTWTVTYTDLNNDAPTVKHVKIDGTGHDMTSTDTTFCDGATFTYSQTLAEGSHSYFFEFKDAASTVFLPSTGPQLVGPTVTTAPPPTTTPTETSPTTGAPSPDTSPSPTQDEPGFEAAILAMAVLVAAAVLVPRRT